MQNYHFCPNFAINYALVAPTQQLYQPIIFIDPSFPFFLPNITPEFQQFAPKLLSPASLEENTSQSHLNHEKTQEKDEVPRKASSQGDSKAPQESIEFLTVANRNILPNNLNLILSYIRRVNKSGRQVRRAIEKLDGDKGNKSVKKFYSYQTYLKQRIPFHKTKHTIKELTQYTDSNYSIFTLKEQMFYNKVCRIVIYNFIRGEYQTNLLTSSKIQKTNKKDHLKIRRYLQLKLEGASQYHLEPYKLIEN